MSNKTYRAKSAHSFTCMSLHYFNNNHDILSATICEAQYKLLYRVRLLAGVHPARPPSPLPFTKHTHS